MLLGGGDDDIEELDQLLNDLEAELAGELVKSNQENIFLGNKTEKSTKSEIASGSTKFELNSVCLEENNSNKLETSAEFGIARKTIKFSQETKYLKHNDLHIAIKPAEPCKVFPEKPEITNGIRSQLDQQERQLDSGQTKKKCINFRLNHNPFSYQYKRKKPKEPWMNRKYRKISPTIQPVISHKFQSQNIIANYVRKRYTPFNRREFHPKNGIWNDFREKYIPVWINEDPHMFLPQNGSGNDVRLSHIPDSKQDRSFPVDIILEQREREFKSKMPIDVISRQIWLTNNNFY